MILKLFTKVRLFWPFCSDALKVSWVTQHGQYSAEAKEERRLFRQLLRESIEMLAALR
jgi:hypothetical protein